MSAMSLALRAVDLDNPASLTTEALRELVERLAGFCPEHERCDRCQAHHCIPCDVGGYAVKCAATPFSIHCADCLFDCRECRADLATDTHHRGDR